VIEVAGREPQAGLQVLGFKIRHFVQDLRRCQSGREQIEDIADANAHATDAWAAAALLWVDGDSISDLVHAGKYNGRSLYRLASAIVIAPSSRLRSVILSPDPISPSFATAT